MGKRGRRMNLGEEQATQNTVSLREPLRTGSQKPAQSSHTQAIWCLCSICFGRREQQRQAMWSCDPPLPSWDDWAVGKATYHRI